MSEHFHRRVLEHRSALFAVLTTVAISIGGLIEILPMYTAQCVNLIGIPRTRWSSRGQNRMSPGTRGFPNAGHRCFPRGG